MSSVDKPTEQGQMQGVGCGDGLGGSAPTWIPLLDVVRLLHHPNFYWGAMKGLTNLKYINLRIDTRDNCCLLTDRDGKPITLDCIQRGLDAPTIVEMNENPQIVITESSGHVRPEYPCTQCGGDAYVGYTDWIGPEGKVIDRNERICSRCAQARNVSWSFHCKPNTDSAKRC